ncbi:MAG: DUF2752 domain-containing protein [Bacteroidales bacterium]|nr:DUF2752 domain-containing protein [Bacteroidales bacterium]
MILWLEANQKSCFFHSNLGMNCPGCGLQTAIIALLHGDLWVSIKSYPALLPVILTLIWTFLYFLVFKKKKGEIFLLVLLLLDFILIMGNWICGLC